MIGIIGLGLLGSAVAERLSATGHTVIGFDPRTFEGGVNVALGLPIVRTAVDHGTAFDIAYHGAASTASLVSALEFAARLTRTGAVTGAR